MIRLALFLVSTLALAFVSRRWLLSPSAHGFHRFWLWEANLALLFFDFVGFREWLRDPLSLRQLASWLLLFGSLAVLVPGVLSLQARGLPEEREREGEELMPFERTTRLVTSGVYRYVRHPMYASLLYLAWGIFLKRPTWPGVLLVLVATGAAFLTARTEEAENLRSFGEPYRDYMKRSRMFVPYLL